MAKTRTTNHLYGIDPRNPGKDPTILTGQQVTDAVNAYFASKEISAEIPPLNQDVAPIDVVRCVEFTKAWDVHCFWYTRDGETSEENSHTIPADDFRGIVSGIIGKAIPAPRGSGGSNAPGQNPTVNMGFRNDRAMTIVWREVEIVDDESDSEVVRLLNEPERHFVEPPKTEPRTQVSQVKPRVEKGRK